MNIFSLLETPQLSARAHCDQHVHKMILESAQLVSAGLLTLGWKIPHLYKPTHQRHPCVIWAGQSNHNIMYIVELATELELIRKETGRPQHDSMELIKLVRMVFEDDAPDARWHKHTKLPLCIPEDIIDKKKNHFQNYQAYYNFKNKSWNNGMTWKNRPRPSFME